MKNGEIQVNKSQRRIFFQWKTLLKRSLTSLPGYSVILKLATPRDLVVRESPYFR